MVNDYELDSYVCMYNDIQFYKYDSVWIMYQSTLIGLCMYVCMYTYVYIYVYIHNHYNFNNNNDNNNNNNNSNNNNDANNIYTFISAYCKWK